MSDVRRCRFIASDEFADVVPLAPPRPGPEVALPVVELRGRVEDEAILGNEGALLRVALTAPDARFLVMDGRKERKTRIRSQGLPSNVERS